MYYISGAYELLAPSSLILIFSKPALSTEHHTFEPLLQMPIRLLRRVPQRPMARWHTLSGQIGDRLRPGGSTVVSMGKFHIKLFRVGHRSALHSLRQIIAQDIIFLRKDEQRRLLDSIPILSRHCSFLLEVDFAGPIPVARPLDAALLDVFGDVIVQFLQTRSMLAQQ
jgi:hypothetical protein